MISEYRLTDITAGVGNEDLVSALPDMSTNIPSEIGVQGAWAGAHLLSRPAEELKNDPNIEALWAIKAAEHMEVYFNLISSVDPRHLRLTPHDDKIYTTFREMFPEFKIGVLNENDLKSEEAKAKWREFCDRVANCVEDANFGTLVRIDSSKEYDEANTVFVLRLQFYAIEIARNREGYNDVIREKFKPIKKD